MRRKHFSVGFAALFAALVLPHISLCDERTHSYEPHEEVLVWTAKVGPYHNPHETYYYESLPLCELRDVVSARRDETIGEALEGHHFVSSPRLQIKFGENIPNAAVGTVCEQTLLESESDQLTEVIGNDYWYQLYVDDLPVMGPIGAMSVAHGEGAVVGIYTHRHFSFKYKGSQIISVDVESSELASIESGAALKFTYSVDWGTTDIDFVNRFDKYLDTSFFEHRVHWFSVVNSFMLCLFLCVVVAIILTRTLKNDMGKYAASEADELESLDRAEESGWKQIHGDVFRRPKHLMLFSVLYGTGCHLLALSVAVLLLACAKSYYARRGMTATAAVGAYAATQIVNGWSSGHLYKLFGGKGWKRAVIYQVAFLPAVLLTLLTVLNSTALVYGSSIALPITKIMIVVMLFLLMCVPLHIIGTHIGRKQASRTSIPCRVHQLRRPIPPKSPLFLPGMILIGGLIPFGCIFIEMYFIFSALWNAKVYYVYGFLVAVLLLLCLVLVCMSITCVYILLNSEDFRWAWTSFLCCASTAIYIFLYAIYYFHHSTRMSGLLQVLYYFGTSFCLCCCLGLVCGSLGYYGASKFVWLIYRNIKSD